LITEFDLEEMIAKYQGIVNPSTNDCVKLAALYTVRNELFPKESPNPSYSFTASPEESTEKTISYDSGTEFSRVIHGRKAADVWERLDRCMTELRYLNPKMYNAILDEIEK
jgi:hypothetical protein